jgi:hypothetical protein
MRDADASRRRANAASAHAKRHGAPRTACAQVLRCAAAAAELGQILEVCHCSRMKSLVLRGDPTHMPTKHTIFKSTIKSSQQGISQGSSSNPPSLFPFHFKYEMVRPLPCVRQCLQAVWLQTTHSLQKLWHVLSTCSLCLSSRPRWMLRRAPSRVITKMLVNSSSSISSDQENDLRRNIYSLFESTDQDRC